MFDKKIKEHCGNCVSFLTDEDDKGNVTEFHHDRNKDCGFYAMRDLFYTVQNDSKPCDGWVHDGEKEE